jgi:hypothetical protein
MPSVRSTAQPLTVDLQVVSGLALHRGGQAVLDLRRPQRLDLRLTDIAVSLERDDDRAGTGTGAPDPVSSRPTRTSTDSRSSRRTVPDALQRDRGRNGKPPNPSRGEDVTTSVTVTSNDLTRNDLTK